MSEIGNAERSAAIFYYRKKLDDNLDDFRRHEADPSRLSWLDRKGVLYLERLEIYDKLRDLGDYKEPQNTIARKAIDDIHEALGEDAEYNDGYLLRIAPKKYKDESHNRNPEGKNQYSNQTTKVDIKETIKVLSGKQVLDTLNPDDLREINKLGKILKERSEFVADTKGIALVDHTEKQEKVSTPKVTPGKSEIYYAQVDAREAADEFAMRMKDMEDLMFEEPPNKATKEEQREITNTIRNFTQFLNGMNKLIKSCTDRKHSFSMWKHAEMQVTMETGFKHQAAKKAAIPIVDEDGEPVIDEKTGLQKVRYMTRERVSDSRQDTFEWMKQMSAGMESFAIWKAYIEYRDKATDLNNRIAYRKDGLHDKLSDASIG